MIALYLIGPFGNIPCVIELSKAVNAKLKAIGASRGMSLESVRVSKQISRKTTDIELLLSVKLTVLVQL